jgi:hypothetical protein
MTKPHQVWVRAKEGGNWLYDGSFKKSSHATARAKELLRHGYKMSAVFSKKHRRIFMSSLEKRLHKLSRKAR